MGEISRTGDGWIDIRSQLKIHSCSLVGEDLRGENRPRSRGFGREEGGA